MFFILFLQYLAPSIVLIDFVNKITECSCSYKMEGWSMFGAMAVAVFSEVDRSPLHSGT